MRKGHTQKGQKAAFRMMPYTVQNSLLRPIQHSLVCKKGGRQPLCDALYVQKKRKTAFVLCISFDAVTVSSLWPIKLPLVCKKDRRQPLYDALYDAVHRTYTQL